MGGLQPCNSERLGSHSCSWSRWRGPTGSAQTVAIERSRSIRRDSPATPGRFTTRIDGVLAARWAAAKIQPAPIADDGEFLRRASLDLIGKIPTAAEARDFLDDPSKDKRQASIERLLDSPAYTTHATEIWRKLLLPEADTQDQARAGRRQLRSVAAQEGHRGSGLRSDCAARSSPPSWPGKTPTMPVASMLDASPAAYFAAKERKPENIASGVASVFLGLRLECAQCHNHPFASWKREQFWSFAAFFAGTAPEAPENAGMMRKRDAKPIRELTIPGTKKVVVATHLDGSTPAWRPRADTREILAEWVTAPDNPYFARAIVNRVWARFFGVGLIEPADDLEGEADPELSKLLDVLAGQFRAHDYKLKFLIRVLTATRAYNLSSAAATRRIDGADVCLDARSRPRRRSALRQPDPGDRAPREATRGPGSSSSSRAEPPSRSRPRRRSSRRSR